MARLTNWAGNVTFSTRLLHRPTSVAELQRLVAGAGRVRALGTGHSFSAIADSPGALVSVDGLPRVTRIDPGRATVTVSAGLQYGELAGRLDQAGWALRNLGSLPHISVAGACATGTHGSGDANGSLATAVSALEMVTAGGDIVKLSRQADGAAFAGAVVALGALGIVTSLTLDLVPAFGIRQYVYERLPRDQLDEHFADVFASGYSVSCFTDWRSRAIRQVWRKCLAGQHDPGQHDPGQHDPGQHDPGQHDPGQRAPAWRGAELATGPAPGAWHARRALHRAAGRARPLASAAAALPAGVHPEQRR